MTKTKKITLNEQQFNTIVKESVKRILKEGFADRGLDEKWIDAERQIGSENMLQEVYNYFNSDQLKDFLESLDNDYDLGLFEDEEEEEFDAEEPYVWGRYKG